MSDGYYIINRSPVRSDWTGSPIDLVPDTTITMTQSPLGPLIIVYAIENQINQMATLSVTAGDHRPEIITIQPGASLPGIHIRDYNGVPLSITNISSNEQVKVRVAVFGAMPNTDYTDVTIDTTVDLSAGQHVVYRPLNDWQQIGIEAQSPSPSLFAIIAGSDYVSNDQTPAAAVFALQADSIGEYALNSDKKTPVHPGYRQTTTATNSSYEFKGDEHTSLLHLVNISLWETVIKARIRRL